MSDVEDDSGPNLVTCPRCGAQYLATATTCADCGARLRGAGEEGDEVAYDLGDWTAEQREELVATLAADGVAARLEETELVVPEADADLAEELIEEVDAPDAGSQPIYRRHRYSLVCDRTTRHRRYPTRWPDIDDHGRVRKRLPERRSPRRLYQALEIRS